MRDPWYNSRWVEQSEKVAWRFMVNERMNVVLLEGRE
jgi:hypothetical protein